jgi:glutamate 5-kinase
LTAVNQKIKNGEKILIVSSGAVITGRTAFGRKDLERALAAGIGQPRLISHYLAVAKKLDIFILEILLSRPHLVQHKQFLLFQDKINKIFSYDNIIPIVNENDFLVSDDDWSFGDNDGLAAALAVTLKAKKLIILSHVEGLYSADPDKNQNADLINVVEDVNAELMKYCSKETSETGRGGMISKLKTARLCSAMGIETQIINGLVENNLTAALSGENIGTVVLPRRIKKSIKNRDRWILSAKSSAGSIEVDQGAVAALKNGKSLLAVGLKKIYGYFAEREIVEIVNNKKEGVAFGIVDLDSKALEKKSFSEQKDVQVIHADNLVVFEKNQ